MPQPPEPPPSTPEEPVFVRLSGREWLILTAACLVGVLVTALLVFHFGSKLPHVG